MKKNKIALVTGSSRGIGESIAKVLSAEGYGVILTGRNEDNLVKIRNTIGALDYIRADLTSDNSVLNLIQTIKEKHSKIDILVNNAGDYVYSPVENTTSEDIKRLLKLNFEAPYLLIKNIVPMMKENKWGRIVNIGSISGSVGEANASLYSATKASLIGMSKALGLELAEYGITVNTINPGWVETELSKKACEGCDFSLQENIEMIPQKRFIHTDEVANLVKYLVSEEAKGLTGQSINLCAGLSIG